MNGFLLLFVSPSEVVLDGKENKTDKENNPNIINLVKSFNNFLC